MKKIFYIVIFLVIILLSQKSAFAECMISGSPQNADSVKVNISNCSELSGEGTYRVIFTAKKISDFTRNDFSLAGSSLYTASSPLTQEDQTISLSAQNTSKVFLYFYIYKFADSNVTALNKGTQVVGPIQYIPPVKFQPFKISAKGADGNVTITGGATAIRNYRVEISKTPLVLPQNVFEGTPDIKDIPSGDINQSTYAFSFTAPYDKLFPTVGQKYYVRQVASYPPNIVDKDTNVVSPDATYGSNIVAQATDTDKHSYKLLADERITVWDINSQKCINDRSLPEKDQDKSLNCSFSDILNYVIKIAIGLAVVALVVRIMYEGFIYMTTDIPGVKISAKGSIMDMAIGILIALTSWVILNTINPTLVNNTLSIDKVTISVEGDRNAPTKFVSLGSLPAGVFCPKSGRSGNIAQVAMSFNGKITYDILDKNGNASGKNPAAQADGTAHLDCSGFVTVVLDCAGYKAGTDFINGGTDSIFNGGETTDASRITSTTINGKTLKPGDIVGFKAGGSSSFGHVLVYIGNGLLAESHGTKGHPVGKGFNNPPRTLESYKDKIKYFKQIPN